MIVGFQARCHLPPTSTARRLQLCSAISRQLPGGNEYCAGRGALNCPTGENNRLPSRLEVAFSEFQPLDDHERHLDTGNSAR